MAHADHPLSELRISDVLTFIQVRRLGSMSAAARELGVSASQVSKAVARLEANLGISLIERKDHGSNLSPQGMVAADELERLVDGFRNLCSPPGFKREQLSIGGQSFLLELLMPRIANCLPEFSLWGVDLPASFIGAFIPERAFDLAITSGGRDLPSSWTRADAGNLRYGLFVNAGLAARLGRRRMTIDEVRELPFVVPAFVVKGQRATGEDRCPLHLSERRIAHYVPRLGVGLVMAAKTPCAVFGPALATRPFVHSEELVEITVPDWKVEDPISVICAADQVRATVFNAVVQEVRSALSDAEG